MTEVAIGLDISKEALDACRFPDGESRRFDNTARATRR
jgi:transposase